MRSCLVKDRGFLAGAQRPAAAPCSRKIHTRHRQLQPSMSCPDCIKGSLDEGTPRGEDATIGGVPCYVSKPAQANGCGVILATDVFGYKLVNARLIADVFADNGYTCIIPDYFKGAPMPLELLTTFESIPTRNFFGKVGASLWLLPKIAGMPSFLKRNPHSYATEVATAVSAALRKDYGATKVGLIGYCYGGTLAVIMSSKLESVDAAISAHPGPVESKDLEAVQAPLLFLCAESDFTFGPKARTKAQQLLEDKCPGRSTFILYPGTKHGFAVRGNKRDPAVNAAREDALKQALRFFDRHLRGLAPPAEVEEAAAGVGKRLVLEPRAC